MKILVINGSPKREHSDTIHSTRAFLEGMNEAARQEDNTPVPERSTLLCWQRSV